MDKEKLTWRSFADDGAITSKWNQSFTPTLYLLDHKGVIRHKWVGSPGEKAIDAALEKLLNEVQRNSVSPQPRGPASSHGTSGTRKKGGQ
jgi:hypothetical protein